MPPYCVTDGDESEPSGSASPSNSTTSEEEFASEEILPPISLPDPFPYDRSLPRLLVHLTVQSLQLQMMVLCLIQILIFQICKMKRVLWFAQNKLTLMLAKVCGTDDIHTVVSVKLKVMTHEICLQRLYVYMPALIELDLTGSHMNSLRDLGCGLSNLMILRVGRCNLDSLDGLFGMITIEELYAPNNNINCVGYCAALPALRILDLQKNNISNLRQIEYLAMCTTLQQLTLKDCPASNDANYRVAVGSMCPKLRMLDGILLVNTGSERCSRKKELNSGDDGDGDTALVVETEIQSGDEIENYVAEKIFTKKHLPSNKTLQRPRTSCITSSVTEREQKSLRRTRPATAQPSRTENHDLETGDLNSDTPSMLTSGGIVCGNLATALRGQRRQKPAWPGIVVSDKKHLPILTDEKMENKLKCDSQNNEVTLLDQEKEMTEPELVEALRKWRKGYTDFRTEHREKWKSEETEDMLQG